jgi:hypothetical protein
MIGRDVEVATLRAVEAQERRVLYRLAVFVGTFSLHDALLSARSGRSLDSVSQHTSAGLSYISGKIQLLYKARHPRPKGCADFECVLPRLGTSQRAWLRDVRPLSIQGTRGSPG